MPRTDKFLERLASFLSISFAEYLSIHRHSHWLQLGYENQFLLWFYKMNDPTPDQNQQSAEEAPAAHQAQNLQPAQMARFVTTIQNAEQQVGEHVIRALQHGDTVAVLTTVVVGPDGKQHIVSAGLDGQTTAQVNALLAGAAQQREEEEMCVGGY